MVTLLEESFRLFDDLLFPGIFQTFRMSIQPTKLIIASLALAVICLAGRIMDLSKTVVVTPGSQAKLTELDIYMSDPGGTKGYIETFRGKDEGVGVFSTLWHFSADRFQGAVDSVFAFNLPGVVQNITGYFRARFSIKRFSSFLATPLAPIGIVAFISAFVVLLGLIGNIPFAGELIVGLGMPLALAAGALIAVILIGAVAGFNLMFPAIAYDGSDCFDAISRSFSYVYARPWRMLFYTAIAAVYGSICYTFVRFFAFLSLWITRWSMQIILWADDSVGRTNKLTAIWPKPEFRDLLGSPGPTQTNQTEWVAAFLVYLFLLVVVGLVVSFIISFYFSANTIIYSLMRNKVDNTPREDIYMPFDEADVEPAGSERETRREQPSSESEPQPDSSSSEQ